MAAISGRDGKVKVTAAGGTAHALASVRSWTVNETSEVIDATVMATGNNYRTRIASFKAWDGQATLLWDADGDTAQAACAAGSSLTVVFYPEGDGAGATTYTGTAIVTAANRKATFDGLVEMDVTFTGTGTLSAGTAS